MLREALQFDCEKTRTWYKHVRLTQVLSVFASPGVAQAAQAAQRTVKRKHIKHGEAQLNKTSKGIILVPVGIG